MRRIISKEEEAKKTKRNQILIGGVLILVMVASTVGYALTRDQNTATNSQAIIYNGLEFVQQSGFWDVTISNYGFSFQYNPNETTKVNSVLNPIGNYANKPLYVDSEDTDATTEIYRNLFYRNQIVERFQNACIAGENCSQDVPTKNCSDNLIVIKESNSTGIKQQQNCVFINGNAENLTELTDAFLFKILGVQ